MIHTILARPLHVFMSCLLILCTAMSLNGAARAESVVESLTPSVAPELPGLAEAEIQVLSLNTWGLPFPIGQDLDERLPRIQRAIQNHDIVLLQETFDARFDGFAKATGYPYVAHHNLSHLWHLRSGLMTLSKYPIIKSEFRSFKNCALPDCLAHKGILFTRIQHPTLGPVDVYNTHFQSRPQADAQAVRIAVNNRLMRQFVFDNNQYYPTILGGDFNAAFGREDYLDLRQQMPLIDTLSTRVSQLGQTEPGGTIAPYRQIGSRESKYCLDYIFAVNNPLYTIDVLDSQILFQDKFEAYYLSDHFAVQSRIRFARQGSF